MKKLLAVFVLTLLLVACGAEEESPKPNSTESDSSAGVENVQSEETKKADKVDKQAKIYADALKDAVPILTDEQGTLAQASYDFILQNGAFFPAENDAIEQVKGKSDAIDIKLLTKNLAPYYDQFVTYEGYVLQIQEETYENGETASWFNIYDEETDVNHTVMMYKTSGDILEEDYVQFWGIPVSYYSYETLDGGFQNSILFFASHVEKSE